MIGNNILIASTMIVLRKNNDFLRCREYMLTDNNRLSHKKRKTFAMTEIALIYGGYFFMQ